MDEQQAPRPKKSRRYTAPPQTVSDSVVRGVFAMPHGAGRPDPSRPPATPQSPTAPEGATPAGPTPAGPTAAGDKQTRAPGQDRGAEATKTAKAKPAPPKAATGPVLPERAAEDDPRRWGDAEDDLGEWMRSQRPPHWD